MTVTLARGPRPQHGAPLVGDALRGFIGWAEHLACGIDLFGQQSHVVP